MTDMTAELREHCSNFPQTPPRQKNHHPLEDSFWGWRGGASTSIRLDFSMVRCMLERELKKSYPSMILARQINHFNMHLMHITAVTGLNTTFNAEWTLLSDEQEDSLRWVLQKSKEISEETDIECPLVMINFGLHFVIPSMSYSGCSDTAVLLARNEEPYFPYKRRLEQKSCWIISWQSCGRCWFENEIGSWNERKKE